MSMDMCILIYSLLQWWPAHIISNNMTYTYVCTHKSGIHIVIIMYTSIFKGLYSYMYRYIQLFIFYDTEYTVGYQYKKIPDVGTLENINNDKTVLHMAILG